MIALDAKVIAIAAIPVVSYGNDPHLADCELARESGPEATRACAECGRARWMHETRHDTCGWFKWVTRDQITEAQIMLLRSVPDIGQELLDACRIALEPYLGDGYRRQAKAVCAAAINSARHDRLRAGVVEAQ